MGKELTGKANSSQLPSNNMYDSLNKTGNSVGHQTGCKKQTTVRFEEDTTKKLLRIQNSLGKDTSFAETVRRTVSEGISQIRNKQRFIIEALSYIQQDSTEQEVQKAADLLKSEIEKREVNV